MSDPGSGRVVIVMSDAPTSAPGVLSVPVPPGYTNHIGSGRDGAGNVFWAATVDGPNSGDVDIVILRRDVGTGEWKQIWTWDEQTYGKHGYGTLQPLPPLPGEQYGRLSCGLSERNAAGQTVAIERIVPAEYARAVWAVGSGGYMVAPGGAICIHNGPLDRNTSIDLDAYNIPHASAISLQLQVIAPAAGRRASVGAGGAAYAMLQAIAQAPHVEMSVCGVLAPSAANALVVLVDSGALTSCQIYVLGWFV